MVARSEETSFGMKRNLPHDFAILAGVAFTMLVCAMALLHVGIPPLRPGSYLANLLNYVAAWVFLFSGHFLYRLAKHRPKSPISYALNVELGPEYRRAVRRAVPIIIGLVVFMPMFSAMKSAIPLFQAYAWDEFLISADRQIHGTDPWRLLQPILGYPIITSAISLAYHMWILLIYVGGLYFALYVKDQELRRQYFASYFAIWTLIGIALATSFASVGPCFVGPLLGMDTFDEQMAYLNAANNELPVFVLDVQQKLLNWHFSGSHGLGRGITAMPSMHVALAFLFFLAMRKISAWAGWVFGLFFLIVLIGSVHLAYHYAIDGYVSILVTAVIWKIAGLWKSRPGKNAST